MVLGTERPPHHTPTTTPDQVGQSCIRQFFTGQIAKGDEAQLKPKPLPHPRKSAGPSNPSNPVATPQSRIIGEHPQGAKTSIPRGSRSPPPAGAMQTETGVANRGKKMPGSLQSWRAQSSQSCEPKARTLILHNPHHLCYANSVLHMLYYARSHDSQVNGLRAISGALTQAARSSNATNIARGTEWACLWHGWRQPTHQHDAAEFLQHLCQQVDCTALRGGWEARHRGAESCNITDEQFTCPHLRLQLARPFQVQDAIMKWHQQDSVHAFTRPPDTLIIQVSRFLHTERGIRKTRQSFQLQKKVHIPVFTDHAGSIEQIPYQLCGGVLHIGKVVTAGHYQAFYFPGDSEDIWSSHLVHDDDNQAILGTAATQQAITTNCYLLAYRQLQRE